MVHTLLAQELFCTRYVYNINSFSLECTYTSFYQGQDLKTFRCGVQSLHSLEVLALEAFVSQLFAPEIGEAEACSLFPIYLQHKKPHEESSLHPALIRSTKFYSFSGWKTGREGHQPSSVHWSILSLIWLDMKIILGWHVPFRLFAASWQMVRETKHQINNQMEFVILALFRDSWPNTKTALLHWYRHKHASTINNHLPRLQTTLISQFWENRYID